MRDVVLTGFMGSGKSTVARILGERLQRDVIDTDLLIEQRAGLPISRIFSEQGERAFRRLEREVLQNAGTGSGRIIATGGGSLLTEASRDLVRGSSVVCLTASPDVIEERLMGSHARPLLDGGNVQELLAARQSAYALFPQVDTTAREPEEVADDVARIAGLPVASICFPSGNTSTVVMEDGCASHAGEILRDNGVRGRVMLVTDENLDTLGWRSTVIDGLRASGLEVESVVLPAGEDQKSLDVLGDLVSDCLRAGIERSDTVVALGGGVVGDLAGMLAATYMRGIRLIMIPTTLLAQVDASIGGKTAVDADGVKNAAGVFYPAELVLLDPSVLGTLTRPLLSDGLAEVVKIGMMRSKNLVEHLEQLGDVAVVTERPDVLWAAARLKCDIVRQDPIERSVRGLLNFGHTVGHALEAASGYRISHGRCVASGMAAETRVSCGECSPVTKRLIELLHRFGLPVRVHGVNLEVALSAALHDKKRLDGRIRVAVPVTVGHGHIETWTEDGLRRGIESVAGELP